MGAHVAGNTGEALQGNLGRITGLDPALPGFHLLTSKGGRLDPSDAEVVDVIHSCGGVLGYLQPLGDVDFFPNAGSAMQPGCCCIQEITGQFTIQHFSKFNSSYGEFIFSTVYQRPAVMEGPIITLLRASIQKQASRPRNVIIGKDS